ncbi:Nif3-like dinuclear metal center hexameric protein [Nanoarchaeota archaeon]
MVSQKQIVNYLNETLNIDKIKDNSVNGLQVSREDDAEEIRRIGFAVDASLETFERAKDANCEILIVHHGLFWEKPEPIVGYTHKRISFLIKNNIALYAVHLPLDKHEVYGNAAQFAQDLGLKSLSDFGEYHGELVGVKGEFEHEKNIMDIIQEIKEKLKLDKIKAMPFGRKDIRTVGIVTGGAAWQVKDAIDQELDLFITGEPSHSIYHIAKDSGMNVIFGGHYATEKYGVKALAQLLKERFYLEVGFIDVPTDL